MALPGSVPSPSTPASIAAQWIAASTPSPSFIAISLIVDILYRG
jgi:hypothetical protein